jgi:hypothetical protein
MDGDEMSKSNPMSFRFSSKTVERILYLSGFYETSQGAVIDRAVRELYEQEEERNKGKIKQLVEGVDSRHQKRKRSINEYPPTDRRVAEI